MKTIAFFNIPAHGHTNPTLAVVKKLCDMGHKVYYFSFSTFKEEIEKSGGIFMGCDKFTQYIDMPADSGDRLAKDVSFATKVIVDSTLAMDDMVCEKLTEIKPDVIVYDSVAYWGKLAAIKLNIPYISSTTTFAFNKYSAQGMQSGIKDLIKLIFQLAESQKHIKKLRKKGYNVKSIFDIISNDNSNDTIVYTSPFFQPFSETFSNKYNFVGPLVKESDNESVKGGKPVVYISLGTVNNNFISFFNNCITAFNNTEFDVIISAGRNINKNMLTNCRDNVKIYDYVDQISVLKTADIFITHRGMNSTGEGLYYSLPLVMYPQTKEQYAVAARVRQLGAGKIPESIAPEDILQTVRDVLADKTYRENAQKISDSFKACGGALQAAQAILDISQ